MNHITLEDILQNKEERLDAFSVINGKNVLLPMRSRIKLVLIGCNGDSLIISDFKITEDNKSRFPWAEKVLPELAKTHAELGIDSSLWNNFSDNGGILVLTENNRVQAHKYLRGQPFLEEESKEGGFFILLKNKGQKIPLISISAKDFDGEKRKTLAHELCHYVDRSSITQMELSIAQTFRDVMDVELLRGSPRLGRIMTRFEKSIQNGDYKKDEMYPELLAYMQEVAIRFPEDFKKETPLLACYFDALKVLGDKKSADFPKQDKQDLYSDFFFTAGLMTSKERQIVQNQLAEKRTNASFSEQLTQKYMPEIDLYIQRTNRSIEVDKIQTDINLQQLLVRHQASSKNYRVPTKPPKISAQNNHGRSVASPNVPANIGLSAILANKGRS